MTQPLRVDVPGLRALGGKVTDHGEELGRNIADVTGKIAPTTPAGWATSSALTSAGNGWAIFLKGLSQRTVLAGEAMTKAANNYQAADERSRNRQRGPR